MHRVTWLSRGRVARVVEGMSSKISWEELQITTGNRKYLESGSLTLITCSDALGTLIRIALGRKKKPQSDREVSHLTRVGVRDLKVT